MHQHIDLIIPHVRLDRRPKVLQETSSKATTLLPSPTLYHPLTIVMQITAEHTASPVLNLLTPPVTSFDHPLHPLSHPFPNTRSRSYGLA